jgi:hypothetical protein
MGDVDESLEYHARYHIITELLEALNWRLSIQDP